LKRGANIQRGAVRCAIVAARWRNDDAAIDDVPEVLRPDGTWFMIERGGGPRDRQVRWVEGEPIQRSFFPGVELEGREPMPVRIYRCHSCGYLESFEIPAT
jgi:hypothetical protein